VDLAAEKILLGALLADSALFAKAAPFIEPDYFEAPWAKAIFRLASKHWSKYNSVPGADALRLGIAQMSKVSQDVFNDCAMFLDSLVAMEPLDFQFACDELEKWIKSRRYYISILEAAAAYEAGDLDSGLPSKLTDALGFNFDSRVGLEYAEAGERFDSYTETEEKLKLPLQWLNEITSGGVPPKTLNMFVSTASGGGKTLMMCWLAGELLKAGKNVLYVTAEMAANRIMERIDANMLSVPIMSISGMDKDDFVNGSKRALQAGGRLFVHEYPTATANCGNVRWLIRELQLKKGFKPDVVFIDYINIFTSVRRSHEANSYTIVKSTCEEFRGLMVETGCVGFSATQGNRSAIEDMDLNQKSVSESVGVNFTADMIIGIISTPALDQQGVYMLKQIKNRYGDTSWKTKTLVGVDKPKMRLFPVTDIDFGGSTDTPVISVKKRNPSLDDLQ
jgi:archaellum biogenesis ATPase FlaH